MKRQHALRYNKHLSEIVRHVPIEQEDRYHPYHLYSVLVNGRDELKNFLSGHNIETLVHWNVGVNEYVFSTPTENPLTITREVTRHTLSLPCSPFLKREEQDFIIEKIKEFYA